MTPQRLLGIAYIAGPVLLVLSAGSFVLGIGLIPPGVTSWVEGIFGAYALALFVPVYLDLGRRLAEHLRVLGGVALVTGLFGATAGFGHEFARLIEFAARNHGAGDAVWGSLYANPGWEFLTVALLGPLFPLTSIILGIGFLRTRDLPLSSSLCLIGAGVGFPLAQVIGADWALSITYPGSALCWTAALLPVGRRLLSADRA
jgi:hypothetical protein